MLVLRCAVSVLALSVSCAAAACIGPAPPIPLPNEAESAYSARTRAYYAATRAEDERRFQVRLFDEAISIELARVTTSSSIPIPGAGPGMDGHAITAESIRALKGEKSANVLSMADNAVSTCGHSGGGPATSEEPGAWIIVFTGISLNGSAHRNYGLPVRMAREPRLLEALHAAALALRDQSPASTK